jgi:uncharacterized RDD family membrane protein YckC
MSELPRETVLALDNIPLELPVAGVGSRVLAAFLDYLAVGLLLALWVVAATAVRAFAELSEGWWYALLAIGFFTVEWGYFAGFEIATGGRTPGKMAVELRVVDRRGGRAGAGALLARNLVRTVDVVVGSLLMALDPLSRRLGDWLGGTLVVHVPQRPREVTLGRVPPGWGAPEVALVEAFLARADDLDPGHALNLVRPLLAWVERDAPDWLAGLPAADQPVASLRGALQVGAAPVGE